MVSLGIRSQRWSRFFAILIKWNRCVDEPRPRKLAVSCVRWHPSLECRTEPATFAPLGARSSLLLFRSPPAGGDLGSEEQEFTQHAERPVLATETVPVERVSLEKETVVDDERINEQVRKERIKTEGLDDGPNRSEQVPQPQVRFDGKFQPRAGTCKTSAAR
ncbi:YsnF/AvaK domain-containing protein [Glutamicibacter ardleyensis]|uniref:YsnF/AvaK domain-containing protein n=1 Tax=Glutamicibacter ardleyensis TaxID=225894 RepID=UPI003F991D71